MLMRCRPGGCDCGLHGVGPCRGDGSRVYGGGASGGPLRGGGPGGGWPKRGGGPNGGDPKRGEGVGPEVEAGVDISEMLGRLGCLCRVSDGSVVGGHSGRVDGGGGRLGVRSGGGQLSGRSYRSSHRSATGGSSSGGVVDRAGAEICIILERYCIYLSAR